MEATVIVIIGDQRRMDGYSRSTIETPFGTFAPGEVVEAPFEVAEWLIHSELAEVARNWRWPGEKRAPVPVATRVL